MSSESIKKTVMFIIAVGVLFQLFIVDKFVDKPNPSSKRFSKQLESKPIVIDGEKLICINGKEFFYIRHKSGYKTIVPNFDSTSTYPMCQGTPTDILDLLGNFTQTGYWCINNKKYLFLKIYLHKEAHFSVFDWFESCDAIQSDTVNSQNPPDTVTSPKNSKIL